LEWLRCVLAAAEVVQKVVQNERLSTGEEIANSISHGLGTAAGITGLVVLVSLATKRGSVWHIVSFSIYGTTLVLLYLSSTLYHALPRPRVKRIFRVFDHAAIYLLIAGTYTPFTLVNLRGPWGWSLFGVVWALAITGVVFKSLFLGRFARMSVVLYVLMGWLVMVGIRPLLKVVPWHGFLWLLAGGLAYTTGVVFFVSARRYAHTVWHFFVMAGTACHWLAVYLYVLPHHR
jgi:hemolysin III